uniref:Uncharacterized protein n=1 Tax=Rhodopseudomonas palustris (strain BisA53) TaxID=316055 RepID=Q07LD3_RHOP5
MNRLTKLEIQRELLAGHQLAWTSAAGKRESIELRDATQRRLFAYLLQSSFRESKGFQEGFITGLAAAYAADNDPAIAASETTTTAQSGPWRLQKMETDGFGGLNICNGPTFSHDFDGESLILQGSNGSGKSSLVGAVIWALTGERPRDHATARPEDRADVYDNHNSKIGTWPPIACYPDEPSGLTGDPIVSVALTFVDAGGTTAIVERRLEGGQISSTIDPALNAPEVLIETGLLMPSRMPQIRFEKGQTPLTRAVQSLTGLDDLIDIGALVDGLCHKGREYLSTNHKQIEHHKALFDSALGEAQRAIKPTGETIDTFQPKDTIDAEGPFARLGKKLRTRAADLTQVISGDIASGSNLTSANVQMEVAGAISIARESLTAGLDELPTWKTLSALGSALTPEVTDRLRSATDVAKEALTEAITLDEQAQNDSRLQLKSLGAQWHEANKGTAELTHCPLCEKPLDNLALKAELQALRRAGEAATRQFTDNLNAIHASLTKAVPPTVVPKLTELGALVPRQSLISDLEARLIAKPRVKNTLATFVRLVTEALASTPEPELPATAAAVSASEAIGQVQTRVAAVHRLLSLGQWWSDNAVSWQDWWTQVAGAETDVQSKERDADKNIASRETLTKHLARLSDAVGEAEPYRSAAEALGRAWKSGREANGYQKIQDEREAIARELSPLKSLGGLAEAQARIAIETLSEEIGAILKRMHLSERLSFKGTNLQRKAGLQVHGGFAEDFRIDATLVANTSWLRAVLWAFLFALRSEAVKQLGGDPLPLLLLDDPQATFDAEHRRRWAMEIVALQQGAIPAQVILATHDEVFVELVKNLDGIVGREGIIVSAGSELGHVGLFEGAALERKWATTRAKNTPHAAQNYIGDVRVYAEGLLRLMLRGQAADVAWATNGFVMGRSRDKIRELHAKQLAPWDKSEFGNLVGQLDHGIAAIKSLEMSHHAGRCHLAMADAVDVEGHWRGKLEPALMRAFNLARDHFLIHGGLRALHAAKPDCTLPEGYSAKVKSLRFQMLGRAAALSNGLAADGRVDLDLNVASSKPIVFGRHFAFRLEAPTLEPVARKGDILLVREMGEPSPKSLVIARCEDRVVARRFEIADNHSDIAVLTAHAINPRQIAQPIVVKRATIQLHKVIGVLFDHNPGSIVIEGEVSDCGGESILHRYATEVKGLVEVAGESAEPIALDGQMLMIGVAVSPDDALAKFEGRPVIAGDGNDNRYFKRLRRGEANTVVLESMEISGDFPPIVLTHRTGQLTDLKEVWPVYGVVFERP